MDDIEMLLEIAQEGMDKAIEHLNHELQKLRTGKASPNLVTDLLVDYHGSPMPIKQIAAVQVTDARTISIQPWERNIIGAIERVLINSNLGMTPQNDGEQIRLTIPPLTEERRKDLVKKAKAYGEDSKVAIRAARHKGLDGIKKLVKDGLPEDLGKKTETKLQASVTAFVEKVEKTVAAKEKEIMTV